MNREIKFRFWLGHTKKMTYEHSLIDIAHLHWDFTEDIVPLQLTGLKDKNGIDIYEGDILQIKTDSGRVENFSVRYGIHRRNMKSGWRVDIPSFSFISTEGIPTFPIVQNYLNGHDLDIIEVVGNIYENPELLEAGGLIINKIMSYGNK